MAQFPSDAQAGDEFTRLLHESSELADDAYNALPGVPGVQFPHSTAVRIAAGSIPLYSAAVVALSEPHAALGAVALMRPLIENWTHLLFIAGDDQGKDSDAACRALQVELGWAKWTQRLVTAAGDPRQIADLDERITTVTKMLANLGCPLRARDFRSVRGDLRSIAEKHNMLWLPVAWQSASQTAHGSGWEWLLQSGHRGSEWVHPDEKCRAGWLNNLVLLFNNLTQTAFLVVGLELEQGPAQELHRRVQELLDHPVLVRSRLP